MSGKDTGQDYDLREVTEGAGAAASVPDGDVMNALCEAMIARDPAALTTARQNVIARLGPAALADAVATIAAFNAYPRAANITGLPLEDAKAEMTAPMRAELGLDSLDTAA